MIRKILNNIKNRKKEKLYKDGFNAGFYQGVKQILVDQGMLSWKASNKAEEVLKEYDKERNSN